MTLIPRPAPPSVLRPELAVPKTHEVTCFCADDQDLARLQGLINRGVDQMTASRMLWGDQAAPSPALARVHPGRWARQMARHTLATAFPWLRLPTPTEVS